jgi:hypothetical protein
MSTPLGSFQVIGRDVLTLILLDLEDYEVIFVTRMLSKAFREHSLKVHWQIIYTTIYSNSDNHLDEKVIMAKNPFHQSMQDYWLVKFLYRARMRLHRYISCGTKTNLHYITGLPDSLQWISPSDQSFNLSIRSLSIHDEKFYEFRGVPPTKDRCIWMVYISNDIYLDGNRLNRETIMKGVWFYEDPAKVAALIVEIAYREYLDDFRHDEQAVTYDNSADPEVLKLFEGTAYCLHPYELEDPFEYGIFELSMGSRDIIAGSRGLPVPFTVETLRDKLTSDFTSNAATQMKIYNVRHNDRERNYILVKRVTMVEFTSKVPDSVLNDLRTVKNDSEIDKGLTMGMVQLP